MDTIIFGSDLHGSLSALTSLLEKAEKLHASMLLLGGDLCPPENNLFKIAFSNSPIEIVHVRGNCDNAYAFSMAQIPLPPLTHKLMFGERTILLTHGDRYPSPYGLGLKKGDIFISGHTHTPQLHTDAMGIICVNPGSTTFPRNVLGPTYGIIDRDSIRILSLKDDICITELKNYSMPRKDQ
ncbi:MAG TPA: YfcE family phosphodiesterase [Sphaerochaeta sp.]|nr:YfcE family phosphodiesterase [Sphaerochaeta sp.]